MIRAFLLSFAFLLSIAAEPAAACVPGTLRVIGIKPTRVRVPDVGSAKVTVGFTCETDSDDYLPGTALSNGSGTIQFKVRLVDDDGLVDDTLGSKTYRNTVRFGKSGFKKTIRVSKNYTLECSSSDSVEGSSDSGEGIPDDDDPADLEIEVDHGDDSEGRNYQAGVPGRSVPAECVDSLLLDPSNDIIVNLNNTSNVTKVCADSNQLSVDRADQAGEQDNGCTPIDPQVQNTFTGLWNNMVGGQPAQITATPRNVQGNAAFQPMITPLITTDIGLNSTVAILGDGNQTGGQGGPIGSLLVTGGDMFPTVTGDIRRDGSFTAEGVGTIGGVDNVSALFEGRYVAGQIAGQLTLGANNELPGGEPITIEFDGTQGIWVDFWNLVSSVWDQAADSMANINLEALIGGVDFSEFAVEIAQELLRVSQAMEVGVSEEAPAERDAVEALMAVADTLRRWAEAVGTADWPSRVLVEQQLERTAELFEQLANQRNEIVHMMEQAPTPETMRMVDQWLMTVTEAGDTLGFAASSAMGTGFTTVSAANFSGPLAAPGAIVSGFTLDTGAAFEAATSLPLPTSLGGVSVRVTDSAGVNRLAGLFFTSEGQINYLVPEGMAEGRALVVVFNGDEVFATGQIFVGPVAPGIFTANSSGEGIAAAAVLQIAEDGTRSSQNVFGDGPEGQRPAVPIDLGSNTTDTILLLFGTGLRGGSDVQVTIDGVPAEVLGTAASAEFAGVDQVNVRIPPELRGKGSVVVQVTVDGMAANPVTVLIA